MEGSDMGFVRLFAAILLFPLAWCSIASAQDAEKLPDTLPSPPHLLLLVHQDIQFGKAAARRKLEVATARACNRLNVPNFWIDMESLTGNREALFFDPFDSYEHLEQSFDAWNQIYATHPELAKMQEEIDALLTKERTVVAERRDDLGYRVEAIDLSEARFMRVVEIRLAPGHENDFADALRILRDTYAEAKAETPWVVYQVTMGSQSPGFIVFVPMTTLKQNDDIIPWTEGFREAEGEENGQNLEQIARDAFATSESNLYAISAEMSHVTKAFVKVGANSWLAPQEQDGKPSGKEAISPAVTNRDNAKSTPMKAVPDEARN
jgi:hypothetical protein